MKWFITGGAGFIGINAVLNLRERGDEVIIFDNLSRKGTTLNLDLVEDNELVTFIQGDITNEEQIAIAVKEYQPDVLLHLAAQVAVTTSVINPRRDFMDNALGTFNTLEAVRQNSPHTIFLNASTNKVYGKLDHLEIVEKDTRYEYSDLTKGVDESEPVDFYSPYGCSKGAADQYVKDYARMYGLKTVTFRQSCIYGPNQFGVEDQGWVAWFTIATLLDKPITIFGDGKQIRDILHVDDLIKLYVMAVENIDRVSGEVFNAGGGSEFTLSLLELLGMLEDLNGKSIRFSYDDWRPGDQKVFVADTNKAYEMLKWKPQISPKEGVEQLYDWVLENKAMIAQVALSQK